MDNRCGDRMVNCYNVELHVPPTRNVGTDSYIKHSSQVRKNPFASTCSRRSPFLNCSFPYQSASRPICIPICCATQTQYIVEIARQSALHSKLEKLYSFLNTTQHLHSFWWKSKVSCNTSKIKINFPNFQFWNRWNYLLPCMVTPVDYRPLSQKLTIGVIYKGGDVREIRTPPLLENPIMCHCVRLCVCMIQLELELLYIEHI